MASTSGGAQPANDGASSSPASPPRARGEGHRGRGRGRGRGDGRGRGRGDGARGGPGRGGGRGARSPSSSNALPSVSQTTAVPAAGPGAEPSRPPDIKTRIGEDPADNEDADAEVCFICANPIIHISLPPCNHATCHICALRLRALYKNKDCPHCRTTAPYVVFTDDATKRFEEYTDADLTSRDDNIGIRYTNEDIVGDTVLLLRYNCPDPSCDFAGLGWPDLHRHVRSVHHKKMCDLCTRNKKVFTHEHELFTDKELERHMRHGDDTPGALGQTGFKGHPICGFCGSRFYDNDKLYEHCRDKHERCFICDRRDSRQPHYYVDYNALDKHFREDHFPCLDRECQEKKFVVFESEMDLKAHQLSEHGSTLSKDVRRDARLVDMASFDYRPTYQQERRGGGVAREGRGRGRDQTSEPLPASSAQPMRRDEIAYQRQLAVQSAQSVSNRSFGGQLTNPSAPTRPGGPSPSPASQQPQIPTDAMDNLDITDLTSLPLQERARWQRHGALVERASNLLGNDTDKISTFRSLISTYRGGSMTAKQLIDAFFALFANSSSNALGTVIRELADLFEDKTKADSLRKAWSDWRAINEDYPSLPGLGDMHGATTASTGWAAAAAASPATVRDGPASAAQQKHTTRVLRLKNSTRRGSAAGLPGATPSHPPGAPARQWGASPPSTASTVAFPGLPGASGAGRPRHSMWIGAVSNTAGGFRTPAAAPSGQAGISVSMGDSRQRVGGGGAALGSEEAFPALPAAPKPSTTIFGYGRGAVRRDVGGRDTGFTWGGAGTNAAPEEGAEAPGEAVAGGKGKKKGKKQILVQWG